MSLRGTISTYEAKAKFSALLRRVRDGESITITWHGEPVAELRPIDREPSAEAWVERCIASGKLEAREGERRPLAPVASRPGALERFLEDRD